MKTEVLIPNMIKMVTHKHMRKLLARKIDEFVYKSVVEQDSEDLESVARKRYEYLSAMLRCVIRNMDKGYVSGEVIKKIIDVFVDKNLVRSEQSYADTIEQYQQRYGELPPTFLVLSPTQHCNLNCIGCYASSTAHTAATIPYEYVDRIVREAHDLFGCRFITISGGEPLMYRSNGRTLVDIFEQHNDMFFHMYTNGTLINHKLAERLARCANITPAISIEGFETETDKRRGAGTFRKILDAMAVLRSEGVPFGVSITATRENVDLLLTDEFYDYYFLELGVCYMWQFQLMPIGRGKDEAGLMVGPEDRVRLFRKWEQVLSEKRYCLADFWNSGLLSRGCIAYGRNGGYFYIDWHGNVTPCAFIPYYVDNIYELYDNGRTLCDAVNSDFMKKGRKWQCEYGLDNWKKPDNWLMP